MILFRKRPHVSPGAVEPKVATILPWSGGGLTARAVPSVRDAVARGHSVRGTGIIRQYWAVGADVVLPV